MNFRNPVRRFFLRRDFFRRVRRRSARFFRLLRRDELNDVKLLFGLRIPRILFDVGANVGFVSWRLAKIFPSATVYAFEPDRRAFEGLKKTSEKIPRIRAFNVAASDRSSDVLFLEKDIHCNSSLLRSELDPVEAMGTGVSVKGVTLDDFCTEHGIERIDLLKVDTEGADLFVLKGAVGLLSRGCLDVVICEILLEPIYNGQATFEGILSFLKGYGMVLYNVYVQQESVLGRARYVNIICVSAGFLERNS